MGSIISPISSYSKNPLSRIYYAFLVLLLVFVTGVTGYMLIEGFDLSEAFYMTVITVSTVGFSEVHELSEGGRLFTAGLIIFSFGTFAFAITAITTYLVSGEFQRYYKDKKVNKNIEQLQNHVIVCGFGRNGSRAAEQLAEHRKDFVVIESRPDVIERLRIEKKFLFVEGDALSDEVLIKAGIRNAGALITTLPEDSDNVYVVLTARTINKKIFIVSRASSDGSDSKLHMAGADNVIMPDRIGGTYMASLVVQPDVMEFVNNIIAPGADPSNIEEVGFDELPTELISKSVGELKSKIRSGAMIIGLKNKDEKYLINPPNTTILEQSTKIFIIGTREQREEFDNFV